MSQSTRRAFRLKCLQCRQFFAICTSCFRGQRYCGRNCSRLARAAGLKRSRRLYEKTPEAKVRHCQRQNRYRRRLKKRDGSGFHSNTSCRKNNPAKLCKITTTTVNIMACLLPVRRCYSSIEPHWHWRLP